MRQKPLLWIGSSLRDLRAFPVEARRRAGHQLHRVQLGLLPDDWKAVPEVGTGVYEIRVQTGAEHRIFFLAKFEEGVYVLHDFEKRSRTTSQRDISLARDRFQAVLALRRSQRIR